MQGQGVRAVAGASELVGVQRLLVALALVLELVAQQGLFGAHGGQADLVLVVIPVLPQPVEAVLLLVGLGRTHTPDDAGGQHQGRHRGCCGVEGRRGCGTHSRRESQGMYIVAPRLLHNTPGSPGGG